MPKPVIEIKHNLEEGIQTMGNLEGNMPDAADDAAKMIAHAWMNEGRRTMQRNGSVVTGTGIRSFRTENTGEGKTSVFGAGYLYDLDTGTAPHYPDTSNYRFIAWARKHGMTRQQLAEIIATKGTRPHPWINETTARTQKKMKGKTRIQVNQAVQDSLRHV